MGGKSDDPKQRVTEYYMTLLYGICHGVVEKFSALRVNDKTVFLRGGGNYHVINKPNLFGGVKKEGGLRGQIYLQNGTGDQLLHPTLAAKMGGTETTEPAYRGIATAFFWEREKTETATTTEDDSFDWVVRFLGLMAYNFSSSQGGGGYNRDGKGGFYWSANQPYIPPVEFKVSRIYRDWMPDIAAIMGDPQGEFAVCIAIDVSLSMNGARLDYAKAAVRGLLQFLKTSDVSRTIDIRIVGWSGTTTAKQHFECTAAEYEELIAFSDGLSLASGTDFTKAVAGLSDFYKESKHTSRYFIFLTDGEPNNPESATTAASTLAGLDVESYAFNLQLSDTTYTALMDNTPGDGVPIINSLSDNSLLEAFKSAIINNIDMNPSHIIRECMVNSDWGLGLPDSTLDNDSFAAAAQTLYDERFGLSMMWSSQASVEDFVGEVINHIEAAYFVNPATGKWTLKLIRGDYAIEDLPQYDETNCTVTSFKRRTPSEATNEIQVTWTNPENEQEEVVTRQDLGSIVAKNGEIVSDNRNYYGVRRRQLAGQLASRDIGIVSAPLASAEIRIDRSGWRTVPGDVIRLSSAEHGADDLVMRVMRVDYGRLGESQIVVTLTEDVFAYGRPADQDDQGAPDDEDVVAGPTAVEFLSPPVSLMGRQYEYPETQVAFLVGADLPQLDDMRVFRDTESGGIEEIGLRNLTMRGTLTNMLPAEALSENVAIGYSGAGSPPDVGVFVIIGPDGIPDNRHEIAQITESGWTLKRGLLDTVPREWAAGTPVRMMLSDVSLLDIAPRSALVEQTYYFVTEDRDGDAIEPARGTYTPTERHYAPARPAAVTVNDVGFGYIDARDVSLTEFTVAWATRNRLTEDSVQLAWSDGSVTPEPGQTATVTVSNDVTGEILSETTGLTDTTYTVPRTGLSDFARIRVSAERDGFESIQAHSILLMLQPLNPETLTGIAWLDANVTSEIWKDSDGTEAIMSDGDPVGRIKNQGGFL